MLIYAAEAGLVNCNGVWAKLISGLMVLLSSWGRPNCLFALLLYRKKEEETVVLLVEQQVFGWI